MRTLRRDGGAVDTPIWFALDGDVLVFRTRQGPKTRPAERANAALHRRYGWQDNVVPLLKLPGVRNIDSAAAASREIAPCDHRSGWPESAIVEVKLLRVDR